MISPSKVRTFRFLSALVVAGALSLSSQARAQVIYSDSYTTGTNGTDLAGRAPDVDLTGATYLTRNRGQGDPNSNTTVGNPAGSANTNGNGAAALSLASGGTFTRVANDSTFTISADISVGSITGSGTAPDANTSTRGVELGFYANPFGGTPTNDANEGFTGFALQNNGAGGILQFVAAGGSTGLTGVTLGGTLSTTAFYHLTITVSTATGDLTSVIFNGTDLTSSFTSSAGGTFTDAATAFAGFGASSTSSGTTGNVDNFSVSVVPEPGSWAMAVIGVVTLLGLQRFRSRTA